MKQKKSVFLLLLSLAVAMTALSFKPFTHSAKSNLKIQFQHFVGNDLLKLDSVVYKNDLGQTYTISKFKYYISNIHLKRSDGKEFISEEYFLVNEEEPESKEITLNKIPEGNYSELSFIVGVDSLHNCSGLQQGALDPVNAMFWAWNTGYIFLKLEGNAAASNSPGHIFEYHIGGFREPNNCIRKVQLATGYNQFAIINEGDNLLKIKVDASEVLKTPNTIDFSKLSSVTDFHNATMVADNYADMFSILPLRH